MKTIDSIHNDTYKYLKQLASSAKHRRLAGETILSGIHLCEAYLQHGGQPLAYVYTVSAADNPEVKVIINSCEKLATPAVLVSESKFHAIGGVENGIGIVFVVTIPTPALPENLTTTALLLEGIQDPGNMGAILRTAAAAGTQEVFISNGSTSAWSPKALRAAMGAHTVLHIYENCDLKKLIESADVQVLATSLDATDTIYQKELSVPVAWLFGNEGSGVSDELLSLNIQKVIVPQNRDVESLNVAASVAICLFEQARQRADRIPDGVTREKTVG